ncbi:MAG TPA: substrate-binding domain-containing protein [Armatimonadota bacterium]|jgi:DNA-binding LacI/PurR family transcriptional regulator
MLSDASPDVRAEPQHPKAMSNSADRRRGYIEALIRRGLPVEDRWFIASPSEHAASPSDRLRLIEMVASPHGPTTIPGAGYSISLEAIQTLLGAGVRVPEDVSAMGFDNAFTAAFRLDARLSGEGTGPLVERFPTGLEIRGSPGARVDG